MIFVRNGNDTSKLQYNFSTVPNHLFLGILGILCHILNITYRQAGCIGTGGVNRDTFHLVLAKAFFL